VQATKEGGKSKRVSHQVNGEQEAKRKRKSTKRSSNKERRRRMKPKDLGKEKKGERGGAKSDQWTIPKEYRAGELEKKVRKFSWGGKTLTKKEQIEEGDRERCVPVAETISSPMSVVKKQRIRQPLCTR